MAYITCRDLTLGYEGNTVVSSLNFVVNRGDYLCIFGENGAGKTTLMKALLNLKKPISGDIITGDGLEANEIGYLPQHTEIQKDFPATVWEVVLSGNLSKCGRRPFFGRQLKHDTEEKMQELGIWDIRRKSYRNLSGGQQQRVLLTRALCATTKVLLLDEPVTGLDPKATSEFYELLKKLNGDGVTIIMISHDVQAVEYASHVLHMRKENSFFGSREKYMEDENRIRLQVMGG